MRSADIGLLAAAFVLSAAITGLVRIYAQRVNLLDVPNQRSSHEVSTPRGGGLGIVLVFLGASVALWATGRLEYETAVALVLGGGLIAAIGFVDDHSHVSSGWRLLVQIIAATIAVMVLGGLPEIQFGEAAVDLGLAGDLLAIFFMVWFTNAFNFMDGIDGIAASEAAFIAVGALAAFAAGNAVGILLGVLAAASLGFLVWNWPPAKLFLGDVGSAFLGFTVIVLAIRVTADADMSVWPWLILAGVFIVDSTVTLISRMLLRQDWTSAHRNHAYQRASRRFGSHLLVTMGVLVLNVAWLLPLAIMAARLPQYGWWLIFAAWIPLAGLSLWLGAGRPDAN